MLLLGLLFTVTRNHSSVFTCKWESKQSNGKEGRNARKEEQETLAVGLGTLSELSVCFCKVTQPPCACFPITGLQMNVCPRVVLSNAFSKECSSFREKLNGVYKEQAKPRA